MAFVGHLAHSRQRIQAALLGLESGSIARSQSEWHWPQALQLCLLTARPRKDSRLKNDRIAPSGHNRRHQGLLTKNMETRNATRTAVLRGLIQTNPAPVSDC